MYIKVFPHGKGSGQAAVEYLTRMDYPGRTENPPVVLRGEPELIQALIASQDRQWKFSAGVLSWGPEDHVTPEREQQLMDDFEQTAFAGLAPDQYAALWVRHSHAGHHELHFVIPRMELSTGKALNPFPPGWQKDFDPLRDVYNWREGWTRPDDPARLRVRTPDHADIHAARLKRWGQAVTPDERTNTREQLTAFLVQRIEDGAVTNRGELIEEIQGLGFKVPRQGKYYLTIEDEDGQRVRLKGGIYCEAWRAGQQNQLQTGAGQEAVGGGREARIADLSAELERVRQRRAAYNGRRFRSQSTAFTDSLNAEITRLDKRHRQWASVLSRTLLGHSLLGMCLFVGMIAASWGLMFFINHRLESLWNEIGELKEQRTELTNTVNMLQSKAWGIRLLEDKNGRFIILPKGSTIKNNWAWGDSPALKLE